MTVLTVEEARRRYRAKKTKRTQLAITNSLAAPSYVPHVQAYYARNRAKGDETLKSIQCLAAQGKTLVEVCEILGRKPGSIKKLLKKKTGSCAWPPARLGDTEYVDRKSRS